MSQPHKNQHTKVGTMNSMGFQLITQSPSSRLSMAPAQLVPSLEHYEGLFVSLSLMLVFSELLCLTSFARNSRYTVSFSWPLIHDKTFLFSKVYKVVSLEMWQMNRSPCLNVCCLGLELWVTGEFKLQPLD